MTIEVTVNGEPREVPAGTAVGQLVTAVTHLASGVAVAVNGEVVPRSSWAARLLGDGDRVEVVTAVQGG
ncbi:MAG TPA: sulfur carrier protein ThiS [Streptosporangiaceae bacterium]|jgi:sulfur carrier protein|nr:sulfur carrier protein ThiS [Streptosporangiaceae bacterium]